MKLRNALACTFAAFAVVGGATGTAQAADDDTARFDNREQVASCDIVEIIDQPNIGPSDNNVDCSRNVAERDAKSVHLVGGPVAPLLHLLPAQG
ncbi:hypothetical protein GTU99_21275 [Streptomyces sp. PRKS01-65]|nr:hypothetical protein [Streptomyces harenosi]NEY34699.1 hypothetical protein [Streptomyces harenosi]